MEFDGKLKTMGNVLTIEMPYKSNIEDGEYHIIITEKEKNKTRRQVNYFFRLVREIATKQDGNASSFENYYGTLLKMAKIKVNGIWVRDDALDSFKRLVKHFVIMEKKNGFNYVEVYVGVSDMNIKEMQKLIEITINYAERIGINTDPYKRAFYD